MSFPPVAEVVSSFIRDNANDLLVLRGRWGVGKTYFWNSLISEASKKGEIEYGHYSYLSLFGINSVEELRNAIIAGRVQSSRINRENALFSGVKKFFKEAESLPKVREWTGGLASYYLFPMVKGTLVCLDDLERKGKDLDFKDLFGLVLMLKEQLNCKVAIIANEGTLAGEERESFRRHGEKLIDIEVEFIQVPEVAFSYVFEKKSFAYSEARSACLKLSITNIRILQRIYRFLRKLEPLLRKCEPRLVEQAVKTLVLYVWSFYDRDGVGPSFEYLKTLDIGRFARLGGEPQGGVEKAWNNLLREYGYSYSDEVDLLIAEYVERGFFDKDVLAAKLEERNALERVSSGREYYRQAWDLYLDSFDDNEEGFVEVLVAGFREKMPFLLLNDLRDVVAVLRKLQRDELANQLVDEFVSTNKEFLRPTEGADAFARHKDSYISDKIASLPRLAPPRGNLGEVVKSIAFSSGWSDKEEDALADASVEDYCNFFKSEHSENLAAYVRRCLQFGEYSNSTERQKLIADKAKQALLKLASESRVNRLRVSEIYGLESPSEANTAPEM